MSYSKKDIMTSLSLSLFIISFAIVVAVFWQGIYHLDIHYLKIDQTTHLTKQQLQLNYQQLIHYQSIFYQGPLRLNDFIISHHSVIHFQEVKKIFEIIQIICLGSGITSLILVIYQCYHHEYRFFKLTAMISIILPVSIGVLASIDFDDLFILFHKMAFKNQYWIFDPKIDPVINMLPETFFYHEFILIIIIIFVLASVCYGLFVYKRKQILCYNTKKDVESWQSM